MSFYDECVKYRDFNTDGFLEAVCETDVLRILGKTKLSAEDFLALLSPVASGMIEQMAVRANQITVSQFGRTILLYTPMYLSNYCSNQCVYCGFNCKNKIPRRQLTLEEVDREAAAIAATGLKHILILTGESRKMAGIDYLKDCCRVLSRHFTSIGIEVYVMDTDEYRELVDAGADSVTIYQETYNEDLYRTLHLKGPKKDYRYRLDGPERGCIAGMRGVNVGALLGLDNWQKEIFLTALHADWLQTMYPDAEVSVSLPRMRPHAGEFQPKVIVSDRDIVQIMTALRIFLPRAGITMSTRESSEFRDNILRLGVTKMSAGSCTSVGGHTSEENQTGQFDISDERDVEQMVAMLVRNGYQPVFKDWQAI